MSLAAWLGLALAATATLLALVLWSVRRHRSPHLRIACDAPIAELMPSLAGLSLATVLPGNRVELLENGAFFDVLVERIATARHTVHFETYLWKDGVLARRLAGALAGRARAGVTVRMLLDAQGSKKIGDAVTRQLRDAGVRLAFFHRHALHNIGLMNDRTHRKLCVIDGREAFVGGHCVTDHWLGDAEDHAHYADLSVHLHGPVVHSVQSAFSENWAGETGELFAGDTVFPALAPAGDVPVHAAFAKPENSAPAVKILHHTALCIARERLWIQNPYFIPEPEAIDAMGEAVRRGVDVRVLMPSAEGSDNPLVPHAAHRNFGKLLRAGVRIFEYPHTLLHQKVMTIDGQWSAIGSSNFDDRSFDTNDELTLAVLDAPLAQQLDGVFERYARRAVEVNLEQWRRRPLWRKARDRLVYLVNELL